MFLISCDDALPQFCNVVNLAHIFNIKIFISLLRLGILFQFRVPFFLPNFTYFTSGHFYLQMNCKTVYKHSMSVFTFNIPKFPKLISLICMRCQNPESVIAKLCNGKLKVYTCDSELKWKLRSRIKVPRSIEYRKSQHFSFVVWMSARFRPNCFTFELFIKRTVLFSIKLKKHIFKAS